jgi:hypothetical protein
MMPMLSYDLHVHPGPSVAPRWGNGERVRQAAQAAGVAGFVWKAHERHTAELCRLLPPSPVRAIGSASLNPWARFEDVIQAVETGARWVWGPTLDARGRIAWELELPGWSDRVGEWLTQGVRRVVLATGHLGAAGRATFAQLAALHEHLVCSITHSLYVPIDELRTLARTGCVFEIDAYTLTFNLDGRRRQDLREVVGALRELGALVYFTSDGGQEATGDPFLFGAKALEHAARLIGDEATAEIGARNPAALVRWLDEGVSL